MKHPRGETSLHAKEDDYCEPKTEIIANSFRQCGIVRSSAKSDVMLHSRLAAMLGGEDVSEELSQSSDSDSDTGTCTDSDEETLLETDEDG